MSKKLVKRAKKYNKYKNNPLDKKLVNAGKDLIDAVEMDDKGQVKLDSAGKPIFKDTIEWDTENAQIVAIWTSIKAVIEERLVPPNDLDAAFDLLEVYAKMQRKSNKGSFKVSLAINRFVGTWHVLNSARMFDLFEKDEALSKAIDELTMWFARQIDIYREVKRREKVEENVSPDDILNSREKIDYYKTDTPSPRLSLVTGENANEN